MIGEEDKVTLPVTTQPRSAQAHIHTHHPHTLCITLTKADCMYRIHQELSLKQFLEAVSIISVLRVDVQSHRVEVTTENQKTLWQLEAVLLEQDRSKLLHGVHGMQGERDTQGVPG